MNNPPIGYYYLSVTGHINYMAPTTAEAAGGKEFLDKNSKVVKYWFVEGTIDFQNMIVEAKILDDYINGK
jgi:hypothetical protein